MLLRERLSQRVSDSDTRLSTILPDRTFHFPVDRLSHCQDLDLPCMNEILQKQKINKVRISVSKIKISKRKVLSTNIFECENLGTHLID